MLRKFFFEQNVIGQILSFHQILKDHFLLVHIQYSIFSFTKVYNYFLCRRPFRDDKSYFKYHDKWHVVIAIIERTFPSKMLSKVNIRKIRFFLQWPSFALWIIAYDAKKPVSHESLKIFEKRGASPARHIGILEHEHHMR